MSKLEDFKNHYEDLPDKVPQTIKSGGKVMKMAKVSKENTTKKYLKTRGEHYKDIVIAVLVTAIVAFIAGAWFTNGQHATVEAAREEVQAQTASPTKK